jgi:hypothetical protein
MAQAVENLPNKCKALSSNPSTTKKKKPNFKGTPLYLDYSKRSHGVIGPNLIDLCKYTLMFAKDEIA